MAEPRFVSCPDARGSRKVLGIFNFDSKRQALLYYIRHKNAEYSKRDQYSSHTRMDN